MELYDYPEKITVECLSYLWTAPKAALSSVLPVFRSVGHLDVRHEYDCRASPHVVSVKKERETAIKPATA